MLVNCTESIEATRFKHLSIEVTELAGCDSAQLNCITHLVHINKIIWYELNGLNHIVTEKFISLQLGKISWIFVRAYFSVSSFNWITSFSRNQKRWFWLLIRSYGMHCYSVRFSSWISIKYEQSSCENVVSIDIVFNIGRVVFHSKTGIGKGTPDKKCGTRIKL